MMSDTHLLCSGCDIAFTLRGYQNHLSQTTDPLCRAVYESLKKSYETNQPHEEASNSSDGALETINDLDIDMEGGSAVENQDLEEVSQLDEDSDFDLEDMGTDWEAGWEQPRDGAPQDDAGEDDPADVRLNVDASSLDEEKSDTDNHLPGPQRNDFDRYIIGDGYGVKPAVRLLYTDKYPSSRAGKALSRENTRDSVYLMSLGGGDNPWAPFHSKKDWEVARWAKLRGVGSTAFSDFLAIDGVGLRDLLSIILQFP